MSMKLRKNLGRLATAFVATAMLASLAAVPASAETGVWDGATGIVTLTHTLDLTNAANSTTPGVGFTYTLGSNSVGDGTQIEGMPVHSGITTGMTTTTATVSFASTDKDGDENDKDSVDNKITHEFTFDFSDVKWDAVGIYRYTVTESYTTDNQNKAVVEESANPVRYLDVYVVNDGNNGYKIQNFVLSKDSTAPTITGEGENEKAEYTNKSDGFTSTYATYSITVKKVVDGDMGNHDQSFAFTIDFNDKLPEDVTLRPSASQDVTVTTDENDNGKFTVSLGDQDQVVISGIPSVGKDGSAVTFNTSEDYPSADNYTTTVTINNTKSGTTNSTTDENTKTTTVTESNIGINTEDATMVVFTNTRNAVSPTGIVMNVAPYALLVVVAAGACFVFLRKRRED